MATIVDLHTRNLDIADDNVLEALAQFENVAVGSQGKNVTLSVFVDDEEPVVPTVLAAGKRLSKMIRGAYAHSVDPDLVSASDIAARIGFSREAVRQWSGKDNNEFPIEFSTVGTDQKVWRWVEIAEWLCVHKHLDVDEDLPSTADVDRINEELLTLRNQAKNPAGWNPVSGPMSIVEVILSEQRRNSPPLHFTSVERRSSFREEAYCVG